MAGIALLAGIAFGALLVFELSRGGGVAIESSWGGFGGGLGGWKLSPGVVYLLGMLTFSASSLIFMQPRAASPASSNAPKQNPAAQNPVAQTSQTPPATVPAQQTPSAQNAAPQNAAPQNPQASGPAAQGGANSNAAPNVVANAPPANGTGQRSSR